MKLHLFLPVAALALGACKPTAEDIELALGAHGVPQAQAQCIGTGLEPLDENAWNKIGALALEAMQDQAAIERMTLGEVTAKLQTLNDPQLVGTLVRTGLGCAMMHGGLDGLLAGGNLQGLAPPRAPAEEPMMVLPPSETRPEMQPR